MEEDGSINLLTKKEALMLRRKKDKLLASLGGIRNLKSAPDMIFVIDTVKEKIAVQEANRLKIPVVAPIDTNCDPDVVDFPIPGNDDAIRSVQLFCQEMAEAIIEGRSQLEKDGGLVENDKEVVTQAEKDAIVEETINDDFSADFSEDDE